MLPQDGLSWLRMSPGRISKIRLHSLVRQEEPFLGADPSGRAPRAGLVQDAACGTGAQRRLVVDETEHGAILVTSEAMRCRFPVSLMTNKDRVATIN